MEYKCFCCDQIIDRSPPPVGPERAAALYELLQALGYSRGQLLTRELERLKFTLPGVAEYLFAHPEAA